MILKMLTENSTLSYRTPAVELKDVYKTFYSEAGAAVKALAGVSAVIKPGEFVTLIGATGCGKTTLLNIIAGMLPPDQGEVLLYQDLRFGQGIAYVFQHYTLFPWRSVLANVSFGMQMHGVRQGKRKKIARQLLHQVGLSEFESAYPYELSGGMRQRTALAQALAIEPRLLLMDEPFGALDDSTRCDLQRMLINLWQQKNLTVLFVTHNIDEALVMGDRVLVFSERPGRIIRDIKIDLPRPRNRLSKEFTEIYFDIRKTLSTDLE